MHFMRCKYHMKNFRRLRNPPQREKETHPEEMKKNTIYICWQEGFF